MPDAELNIPAPVLAGLSSLSLAEDVGAQGVNPGYAEAYSQHSLANP
jgi:hypothetical protein